MLAVIDSARILKSHLKKCILQGKDMKGFFDRFQNKSEAIYRLHFCLDFLIYVNKITRKASSVTGKISHILKSYIKTITSFT